MPTPAPSRRLFAPLLLALVGLLLLPQIANAQPPPPALFFGTVAEITVDGQPYDSVLPIELINADGTQLGLAAIVGADWSISAPPDAGDVRFRIGGAVTTAFSVVAGSLTSVQLTLTTPAAVVERTVALVAGFNGLAFTGEGPIDPSEIQAGLANPSALTTIYQFDSGTQGWLVWRAEGPTFANSLTTILQNAPLQIVLSAATTYTGPIAAYAQDLSSVAAGFTAITFLGQDGTSLADALAQVAVPSYVDVVFRFNGGSQTYDVFRSAGPSFANNLLELNRFDVLLVLSSTATTWGHDAFQP